MVNRTWLKSAPVVKVESILGPEAGSCSPAALCGAPRPPVFRTGFTRPSSISGHAPRIEGRKAHRGRRRMAAVAKLVETKPAIDVEHLARMTLGERSLEREVLELFDRQGELLA